MTAKRRKSSPVVFEGLAAGLRMFRWVVVILLVLFCFSGVQKIDPENVGLLLRFGKLQGESGGRQIRPPGLVLALPYPIDRVLQVPVKREGEVVIEEVWKELSGTPPSQAIDPVLEGYCLTGDQNMVQIKIVAKYRITDPVAFELWADAQDRDAILRDVVLAALTQTVATWDVDDVLNVQREIPVPGPIESPQSDEGVQSVPKILESLPKIVMAKAQRRLDALGDPGGFEGCGLTISSLDFTEKNPPRHVLADFQSVQSEKIAMDAEQQRAKGDAAGIRAKARTERDAVVKQATAYENAIKGQVAIEREQFERQYAEYQQNPGLIWRKVYEETLEFLHENAERLYFVPPGSRVILPGESQP